MLVILLGRLTDLSDEQPANISDSISLTQFGNDMDLSEEQYWITLCPRLLSELGMVSVCNDEQP